MFSKSKTAGTLASASVQYFLIGFVSVFISVVLFKYFSLTNYHSSFLFFSVIATGFVFTLLSYTKNHLPNARITSILTLFSIFLATSIILGDKINKDKLVNIIFTWKDVFYWVAWLILIFCVSNFIYLALQKNNSKIRTNERVPRKLWLWASLSMLVLWLPYHLAYFPGILNSDTSDQLSQALGATPLNNHHPVLIAGFISLFTHIGLFLFNNYYAAIAVTTIVQMMIAACILGYAVVWIHSRFSNPTLYIIAWVFFALFPIIPYFIVTIGKDTFFALSVLIFSIKVYDLVLSKGMLLKNRAWLLFFIATMLLVIFTRNNGIYIIILSSVVLSLVFRQLWKYTLPTFTFVVIVTLLIQGPIFSLLNIRLSSSAESFGVMMQQIARTVAANGNLSTSDKKTLTELMPLDTWGQHYNPATPDRLKFCLNKGDVCLNETYLDAHKDEFIQTWISIGLKNPRPYIEASLTQSSGFWHVGAPDEYGSFKSDEKKYTNGSIDVFKSVLGIRMGRALQKLVELLRSSAIGIVMNQGALIWLVILSSTILTIHKRYNMLVVLMPLFSLWLSLMLAAPAMSFRYSLATFFMLPIVLAITVTYGNARKGS